MSAASTRVSDRASSGQAGALYARRTRSVWVVIALSSLLFCVVCSASGAGAYGYLSSITRAETARLQLVPRSAGSQLVVLRSGKVEAEAVQSSTTVGPGDRVQTGPDTEANIDLFDGSTVHIYFNTELVLNDMSTSRFFGSRKAIRLSVSSHPETAAGTVVLSTADPGNYAATSYTLSTPHAEVRVADSSTVRVQASRGPRRTPG
jgi:hypothetical protein